MKTKKILKRLSSLLSSKGKRRDEELESIQELLLKLEKREQKIAHKLAAVKGSGAESKALRKRLSNKLRVLQAQRAKGAKRYSKLLE